MGQFLPITEDNFEKEIIQSKTPVILEFGAEWCVPCKRIEPILSQLGELWAGKVRMAKIDVDQNAQITMQYQVMSVPTIILFVQGQPVQRLTGLQPKERLVEKFEAYL
jgi:thioredoxin 1